MNRLARRLKNAQSDENVDYVDNDKLSLPTSSGYQPIDTEEQEELIRSLELSLAQQSRFWRYIWFYAIIVARICGIALLLCGISHLLHSWTNNNALGIDSAAVLVCLMAIAGLLHSSWSGRRYLWFSCFSGVLLAAFWLYNMLKLPKFRWDVIWLPFGPLSGAGLCLYVDSLFNESSEEVKELQSYMYAYKSR
ncbi:hypothetical protein L1987_53997 [Smallanthus sonchifolius]|uniref:Uncharacterized protein n=1 Tax=Smallanthus sonchifolius TaxID=185202 RepID=A0ACB9E6K9_9ASTR|nr:hypothetical protein L1987_53997 [Smallanthus sonchifolius]